MSRGTSLCTLLGLSIAVVPMPSLSVNRMKAHEEPPPRSWHRSPSPLMAEDGFQLHQVQAFRDAPEMYCPDLDLKPPMNFGRIIGPAFKRAPLHQARRGRKQLERDGWGALVPKGTREELAHLLLLRFGTIHKAFESLHTDHSSGPRGLLKRHEFVDGLVASVGCHREDADKLFDSLDADKDGFLSVDELKDILDLKEKRRLAAIRAAAYGQAVLNRKKRTQQITASIITRQDAAGERSGRQGSLPAFKEVEKEPFWHSAFYSVHQESSAPLPAAVMLHAPGGPLGEETCDVHEINREIVRKKRKLVIFRDTRIKPPTQLRRDLSLPSMAQRPEGEHMSSSAGFYSFARVATMREANDYCEREEDQEKEGDVVQSGGNCFFAQLLGLDSYRNIDPHRGLIWPQLEIGGKWAHPEVRKGALINREPRFRSLNPSLEGSKPPPPVGTYNPDVHKWDKKDNAGLRLSPFYRSTPPSLSLGSAWNKSSRHLKHPLPERDARSVKTLRGLQKPSSKGDRTLEARIFEPTQDENY